MLKVTNLFGKTKDKVKIAIERIKHFEPEEGYYVAFSGGKDSIVVLDLVKRAKVKFDAHYNLTTVDPPELVRFIKSFDDVKIDLPDTTMWKLIPNKRMPPTMIARYCCKYFKEAGGINRLVITGVRWAESSKRSKRRMVETCFKNKSKTYLHPIIEWEDKDVWDYINLRNLEYCELYNEGYYRLGCILCPYAKTSVKEKDIKRYPKYYQAYIKAFERMIEAKKERGLKTDWKTGQEVMDWWLYGNKKEKVAEGQMRIYE